MIEAAGYLVTRNSSAFQFLLMKHRDRWDLPKGHAEKGESLITTADRELFEETGIATHQFVRSPDFQFQIEYQVPCYEDPSVQRLKRVTIFHADLKGQVEIQTSEHEGYKWFDWNPPHQIQLQTIDPLLLYAHEFFTCISSLGEADGKT